MRLLLLISFCFLALSSHAQFSNQSVLSDGELYKIEIEKEGIYRLTYDWLRDQLDVDPAIWNTTNIQLFGNGGGELPEPVLADRPDDIQEVAIEVVDGGDGKLDAGDYILFYVEGADETKYDESEKMWFVERNAFDAHNYYFLKIGNISGKRIQENSTTASPTYSSTSFDKIEHFEEDKVNLLDEFDFSQGSGKRWYGDFFDKIEAIDYDFQVSNLIKDESIQIKSRLAARSRNSRRFSITTPTETLESNFITSTSGSFREPSEARYANIGIVRDSFLTTTDNFSLRVNYTGDQAWLDYITLNARCELRYDNQPFRFSDIRSLEHTESAFEMRGTDVIIWDITDPATIVAQTITKAGDRQHFTYTSDMLRAFYAFRPQDAAVPKRIFGIPNQNLHGLTNADFLIVYHSDFKEQAEQLARHRRSYSGIQVETVLIDEIFNEFSSGKQDPTAIRDFAKMMYDRSDNLRYLLLFGDGSFDYRNIKNRGGNFIPVYETDESEDPIDAFPTDDFFALLDEEEGGNLRGDLDIAVGRLPVQTVASAQQVVDKIIRYDVSEEAMGDWRNRVAFVADDEDNNLHLRDTDRIAGTFKDEQPAFNQEKIYFDAFPQQSTSGGEGFPAATEALKEALFKGVLAINYLGHGGSQGWAQERVLDKNRGDIKKLNNRHQLPVFVTATCSFSGYDDPNQVTGGEEVILNPQGGGIALFTTVRAVYASSNAALVRSVFDTMFQLVNGERPTLGHIMRTAKNASSVGRSDNSRKFTLLGDPSQPLALPLKKVVTTSVSADTLRALQKVTITGEVQNRDGSLATDFNGTLTPTIFDKTITYTTLAQDEGSSPFNFDLQKNVVFRGNASITNGQFTFTFVMPKDINFEMGAGRISYYAKDAAQRQDASGIEENIIIGGADEAAFSDVQGPAIQLFLEDESFEFGDETSSSPLLIVKLQDDNGINVSGNSIGHDLEAILDDNTQNTILLNDFYEAELDDYTRGEVRFPLRDLAEGLHEVRVKAWDIANNSSEAYTEFVVVNAAGVTLTDVLTFPNPFDESTCFGFEHPFPNEELDVQVQIFNVQGQLVKVIQERIFADGKVVTGSSCIPWDGKSSNNFDLPKGVYLYRINVQPTLNSGTIRSGVSSFEKVVLMR
ncbi:MAG: type IX secretion system sortase PorU [Bacteroidota bacterium]